MPKKACLKGRREFKEKIKHNVVIICSTSSTEGEAGLQTQGQLGKCFSSLMCLDYKVSGSYCLSLKRGCEVVFSYYLQNNSEGSSPPPHDV